MGRSLLSHKAVATLSLNMASTAVNTNAYTQLIGSLLTGATAIEVLNTGGKILKLAQGAPGSEVDLPYLVPPGGTDGPVPLELKNGQRLSAKALDANSTTGWIVINIFG